MATLNSNILSDLFLLPTTEETFSQISNSQFFAKVDLNSAYCQIELNDEAKEQSVINTHAFMFSVPM